jgi:hypothetical protein
LSEVHHFILFLGETSVFGDHKKKKALQEKEDFFRKNVPNSPYLKKKN